MKWFVAWLALVSGGCHDNATDPNPDPPRSSAPSVVAKLDAAATGSACDPGSLADTGPFAPAANIDGSTAIAKDSPNIVAWGSALLDVDFGANVDPQWMVPERGLGPAQGTSLDVLSLGEGGIVTLGFDLPIVDGDGFDFCVFENGFSADFLEFAYVEVASRPEVFVRMASRSRVAQPVPAYGTIDPALVDGLAGKYQQGYCMPFDLASLRKRPEVATGELDLSSIRYVRLRDIIGDGRDLDCAEQPIYDPFPTSGGAGFDLDAVAVLAQPK